MKRFVWESFLDCTSFSPRILPSFSKSVISHSNAWYSLVMNSEQDLISTNEAARLLHMSPETLRRRTEQGKLKAERTTGGHRRWSRADVLAYAHQQKQHGDRDTITIVEEYPAVWKGTLIVTTDGSTV